MDYKWIEDFKNNNNELFYKEKVESIQLYIFYINKNKVLDVIKKELLILDNNNITSNFLISVIKKKKTLNSKNYILDAIFKSNLNINQKEVLDFINDKYDDNTYDNFFKKINYNNDIYFEDTITILQDMNNLILFFIEKNDKDYDNKNIKINKTKKNYK